MKKFLSVMCVCCMMTATDCFFEKIQNSNHIDSSDDYEGSVEISVSSEPTTEPSFNSESAISSLEVFEHEWERNLSEGRADHIEFGIGDKASDILSAWGEPDEKEYFMGGDYYRYEDIIFFVGKGTTDYVHVAFMAFIDNATLFGVQIGMNLDEIKEILGSPTDEGIYASEYDELFPEPINYIDYVRGSHKLRFAAQIDSDIVYVAVLY